MPSEGLHRTKLVNALQPHGFPPESQDIKEHTPELPEIMEQTDVLSNYLHEMEQMLNRIDKSAPSGEYLAFAARVTKPRKTEVLPRKIADMMHTINAMRVQVVKGRSALPADEWVVVQAIWKVLDRWRKELSFQAGKANE